MHTLTPLVRSVSANRQSDYSGLDANHGLWRLPLVSDGPVCELIPSTNPEPRIPINPATTPARRHVVAIISLVGLFAESPIRLIYHDPTVNSEDSA